MTVGAGLVAVRPWLLGSWVLLTAWVTAASFRADAGEVWGFSGLAALVALLVVSLLLHLGSKRQIMRGWSALSGRWLAVPMLTAITILVVSSMLAPDISLLARVGLALGAGLVPASVLPLVGRTALRMRLAAWGAAIAHLGAALVVVGISGAAAFASDTRVVARAGERIEIGPWLVEYRGVKPVAGPDFTAIEAELRATRGDGVSVLRPQARTMISPAVERSAQAATTVWSGRLSTSLGEAREDGWSIDLRWAPFVTLGWLGGGLMAIGGLIALAGLRGPWPAVAALALALALVGFGLRDWTGRGGQPQPAAKPNESASLVEARGAFLGQFHRTSHWLIISDSYASRGQTQNAATILQSAIRAHPRDYALWLGLGNALTDHAKRLTPAARLAFARSAKLAPSSPAPGYFLGLAKARSGDPEGALADWNKILADAPATASWRPLVEDQIATIEGLPFDR